MLGRLQELPAYLEAVLPAIALQEERTEMGALALAVRLRHEGAAMEQIERLISIFYSVEVWDELRTRWLCEDPLDGLLSSMADNGKADEACSALLLRLKRQFSCTPVSQQALRTLFYS